MDRACSTDTGTGRTWTHRTEPNRVLGELIRAESPPSGLPAEGKGTAVGSRPPAEPDSHLPPLRQSSAR